MTAQPAFDLDAHIKKIVDAAPPFSLEQRRKLGPLWATSRNLIPGTGSGSLRQDRPAAGRHTPTKGRAA